VRERFCRTDIIEVREMPTSLFTEMDRAGSGGGVVTSNGSSSLEEQRALQLAFELSMLGLEQGTGTNGPQVNGGVGPVNGCGGGGGGGGVVVQETDSLQPAPSSVFEEARSKKSQNMTECVPVPSSEHVAEIVGRQGESTC
jgi:RNA-binding protein MEX3